MVIKIGICDDDVAFCGRMEAALKQYAREHGHEFYLSIFHSGEELLRDVDKQTQVLFLDIAMNGLTGMEVARKLRECSSELRIIFVTSMVQYAVEGYWVRAFGFLTKPVSVAALERQMDDVIRSFGISHDKNLGICTREGAEIVRSQEILYVESFAHRMRLICQQRTLECSMPMKRIEEELSDCGFFRCHKCYLVNFRHVASVGDNVCVLDNQAQIPISRQRRKEFIQAFNCFVGAWI